MPTINELPSITIAPETSVIVVTQSTTSSKITVSDLRNTLVKTASSTVSGTVKVGSGLSINSSGVLSVTNFSGYTLPTATNTALGGVKIGSGLSISSSGVISVTQQPMPTATNFVAGIVKIGDGLNITTDGVLSNPISEYNLPTASNETLGGIKVGRGLAIQPDGVLEVSLKPFVLEANHIIDENYETEKDSYSLSPITIGRNVRFTVGKNSTWTIYKPGSVAVELYNPPPAVVSPSQIQSNIIDNDLIIPTNSTATSYGPMTVSASIMVEIGANSRWIIN